jgi:hypothetical protein
MMQTGTVAEPFRNHYITLLIVHNSKIYNARFAVEIGLGFYNVGLELATQLHQNQLKADFILCRLL